MVKAAEVSRDGNWPPEYVPSVLFRFLSFQRAKEILTSSSIYLCAPSAFNDPFDCRLRPSFEGSRDEFRSVGALLAKQMHPGISRTKRKQMVRGARSKLNWEFFESIYSAWEQEMLNNSGMVCLTERSDDILMWSHYGDNHAGVCLGFTYTIGEGLIGRAVPIRYLDAFPDFSFVKTLSGTHARSPAEQTEALVRFGTVVFLTKASHWAYEKEWRVIDFPVDGQPRFGARAFPAELLVSVILGCRMNQNQRREMMVLSQARSPRPTVYEAVEKHRKFALEIRPIKHPA
jgi:hypothetical protein